VRVIRFERNLGFAEAYNRAVASVGEDIVVFLNNDVQVEENWLAELRSALDNSRESDRVAVCGSKILLYHDRTLVNHAGGKLLPIGGGIDLDMMKHDEPDARGRRFVGCVSGASMIVPRSAFLRLGGFDPDFFAYFEDVDLCWRAWLAGYRVLFVPSSRIYHELGATMGPFLRTERLFLGERNRLQSMLKNLQCRNLVVGIFVSVLYDLRRLVRFLRSGRPDAVRAIFCGDWWVLSHLPIILIKRLRTQRSRRVSDAFLLRHGLMASVTEGWREFMRLEFLRST
jgi:hypothetical protein